MSTEFESSYGYFGTPRWNDFSIDDENRARKRFSRFFLGIAIFIIVANLIGIAIQLGTILIFGKEKAAEIINGEYFIWIAQVISMYLIAFPIFYLIVRSMRNTVRAKSKMRFKEFIEFFLIAEGLMTVGALIGNTLSSLYSGLFGYEISNTVNELIMTSPLWVIIPIAVIIGPIIEELMFRKLLMDKLGMYGDRVAIIVSAISFGVFYGNVFQVFYAAMLGALLAYVYSKTGNLLYSIAIHITVNLFGSVLPLIFIEPTEKFMEIYEQMLAGAEVNMSEFYSLYALVGIYAFIQYGMAIAGIVLLMKKYKSRQIFVSDRCEILIPKEKRTSVIIKNAGAITFIIRIVATL